MKYMWRDTMSGKTKKQRARTPHSLRSEWFRLLREVSERENDEGVTAMTEPQLVEGVRGEWRRGGLVL